MKDYKQAMMRTAFIWAEESYCKKRKVGAVVERNGHILDVGYNGTVSGKSNDCEETFYQCPQCHIQYENLEDLVFTDLSYSATKAEVTTRAWCKKCTSLIGEAGSRRVYKEIPKISITSDFTIHAEQNIIANCAKEGISLKDASIYITTSPCKLCAKLIVGSGIKRVYYATEYKDLSGISFLRDCGIEVNQVSLEEFSLPAIQ